MLDSTQTNKQLRQILPKNSGRDNAGHISVRHQGGRHKRFYRLVDFTRLKEIPARVESIEYDPNRNARVALIIYEDGKKAYILAPSELSIGDRLFTGKNAEVKHGNALKLADIPIGTVIHNIELIPGRGAKIVRAAGASAVILAKEGGFVQVKLPSAEIRRFSELCVATVGQIGNIDFRLIKLGKAGRSRHLGIRPTVRGVAQNPRTHPHGGGEGRSGIGMKSPKSPWGKRTLGVKTRKPNKYSNKFILQRRKK